MCLFACFVRVRLFVSLFALVYLFACLRGSLFLCVCVRVCICSFVHVARRRDCFPSLFVWLICSLLWWLGCLSKCLFACLLVDVCVRVCVCVLCCLFVRVFDCLCVFWFVWSQVFLFVFTC